MNNYSPPMPKLLGGETAIQVREFPSSSNDKVSRLFKSSLRAIKQLSGAKNTQEIGSFGPVMAAESITQHELINEFQIYKAVFGRDSLRVASDLIKYFPKLTQSTLIKLAEFQGTDFNESSEEEPGRIPHEIRDPQKDKIAQELTEERGWQWPYFGSVDATVEFIRTFLSYFKINNSKQFLNFTFIDRQNQTKSMIEAFETALDWLLIRMSSNSHGLLEFKRTNPNGIENQVWKDSWDSYFHKDNTIANHELGIASFEVQASLLEALLDAVEFYEANNIESKYISKLNDASKNLAEKIFSLFWCDDSNGYFVLGIDKDSQNNLRQIKVRTSNMGHILHCHHFNKYDGDFADRIEAIIINLFTEEMLSYSGIRTLASDEIRFRPGAYHNGSVWIWDNYLIARGLEIQGYFGLASLLKSILLDDVNSIQFLPEFLRGDLEFTHSINKRIVDVYDNTNKHTNRIEQPPQDIQAWSASAILAIKLERNLPRQAIDPVKRDFENKILDRIPFIDKLQRNF